MEGDAVGSDIAQASHRFDWIEGRTSWSAEWIAATVADHPMPEGELLVWLRNQGAAVFSTQDVRALVLPRSPDDHVFAHELLRPREVRLGHDWPQSRRHC